MMKFWIIGFGIAMLGVCYQSTYAADTSQGQCEMLVNGNFADGNANWVLEESGATGQAECVKEGPDGKPAFRIRVLTTGDKTWRLQVYQTGMRVEKGRGYIMTFWARSDRDCNVTVNCMQNHEPWDHHTQKKMPVSTEWKQLKFAFIAPWDDNNVRISFTDLATVPGQVYWFADCSLVPGPKVKADGTPASKAFIWKGDCSSEAAFVNSNHQIIPGHYEYLPDTNEPKRGLVFAGHLTPDFTTADPEKFHCTLRFISTTLFPAASPSVSTSRLMT